MPQFQTGDYINSEGKRYDGPQWNPQGPSEYYWKGYKGLNVGFLQFDPNTEATPSTVEYVFANNNKWYEPYRDGESWTFDGAAWVLETDIGSIGRRSVRPTFDQNCVIVTKNDRGTVSQRYCASEKKLDGQLMTKFIPSICTSGTPIASGCTTAVFPSRSSAYDLTATTIANLPGKYNGLFDLWVNKDGTWRGFCTKDWDDATQSCTSSNRTLIDFINWSKGSSSWP